MYRIILFIIIVLCSVSACKQDQPAATQDAETIKNPALLDSAIWVTRKAIEVHGGKAFLNSIIEFDFREHHFKITRKGGSFSYERIGKDSTGNTLRDVLTNANFHRERNGQKLALTEKDSSAFANAVNSVVYFALLPYFLQDRAVKKTLLGKSMIKGEPYYKIAVQFDQAGGGKDFQDKYTYWFHQERFTMDYLAYTYETDEGGARFREAYNIRKVEGIHFADYRNFKPRNATDRALEHFDRAFENGGLEEISTVELKNVKVHLLN